MCPTCARWAAEVGGLTVQLRQAELREPELMPLLAPRRVRFQRSAAVVGAVASVAAAALGVLAVTLPAARSPGFQGLGSPVEADAARATVTIQPASPAVRPSSQPNQNRPGPD
jgi:hypothetical protein